MSLLRKSRLSSTPDDPTYVAQDVYDAKVSELREAIETLQEDVVALDDKLAAALQEAADNKQKAAAVAKALADYEAGFEPAVKAKAAELAASTLADNGVQPVEAPKGDGKNQITKSELAALQGSARAQAVQQIRIHKTLELIDG